MGSYIKALYKIEIDIDKYTFNRKLQLEFNQLILKPLINRVRERIDITAIWFTNKFSNQYGTQVCLNCIIDEDSLQELNNCIAPVLKAHEFKHTLETEDHVFDLHKHYGGSYFSHHFINFLNVASHAALDLQGRDDAAQIMGAWMHVFYNMIFGRSFEVFTFDPQYGECYKFEL